MARSGADARGCIAHSLVAGIAPTGKAPFRWVYLPSKPPKTGLSGATWKAESGERRAESVVQPSLGCLLASRLVLPRAVTQVRTLSRPDCVERGWPPGRHPLFLQPRRAALIRR